MLTTLYACMAVATSAPGVPGFDLSPIERIIKAEAPKFRGRLGVFLKILSTGQTLGYRENERFPSASTIKTGVMVEAVCRVDEGTLKWTDKKAVLPTGQREASMWSYSFKDGTTLDVDGWVNLMVGVSDNTATMVLRDLLGTMNINRRLANLGLTNTMILGNAPPEERVVRRLRTQFGMGVTTPREMNRLLELIHLRKAASPAGCDRMLRILGRQYWDDCIGASVPPDIQVASKSGAINRSRSDTAIVYGPHPYILCLYTDSQKDQRWTSENEGEVLLAKIANRVWNHLNPQRPYKMPPGSWKFMPTGGGV